jgi:hypothetical protein
MLTNTAALPTSSTDAELRKRALAQLKKKAQFRTHARVYLLVNALHVVIWAAVFAITGAGFFWPIFPALGWAVGLAFHARDVRRPTRRRRSRRRMRSAARSTGCALGPSFGR